MIKRIFKNLIGKVILVLAIYTLFVGLWFAIVQDDIHMHAVCCGLYGDYMTYWLPFPIIRTSEWSDVSGGPTQLYPLGLVLDVLLPCALVWYVTLRHRAAIADGLS